MPSRCGAMASAFGRKFLGYALWVGKGKEVRFAVAKKALDNFKAIGRAVNEAAQALMPNMTALFMVRRFDPALVAALISRAPTEP